MFYFGSRTARNCDPSDLFVKYFTSSKIIKTLIEQDGVSAFRVKIDRIFESKEQAIEREYEVLKHFEAGSNDRFFNMHHSRAIAWTEDMRKAASEKRRGKGNGMFGRKHSAESRLKMSKPKDFSKTNTSNMRGMTGKRHNRDVKAKMSISARRRSQVWKFTNGTDVFVGCLSDWAERYGLNKNSAATVFCAKREYFGWSRRET